MDLPESPELDFELQQLKKWTCMLDELQHTTAIVQMIQETSLAQVQFLMEVLKQREIELTILNDLTLEYCPFPQELIERRDLSSPSNTNSTDVSPVSSSASFVSPFSSIVQAPLPRSSTLLSPPPGFPYPILSPSWISKPQPVIQISKDINKVKNKPKTDAQINLIRLTTLASQPAQVHKKRPRKIPHFPRDESDPKWLLNWLHSLRLHKYGPCLKGLSPRALLELDEDELIDRGIGSIGARKKLIVAFGEATKQIAEEEKNSV